MRKPFYRKREKWWYVKDDHGKDIKLSQDETEAYELWQQMRVTAQPVLPSAPLSRLVDEWAETESDGGTEALKTIRIATELADLLGTRPAASLQHKQVLRWLNADKPGQIRRDGTFAIKKWSQSTKRHYLSFVKTVTKWAAAKGHIPVDPLADLNVPDGEPREQVMTRSQLMLIKKHTDREFFLFLTACFYSGVRQSVIRELTAANVSPCGTRWVMPNHKTKGKTGKPLVVYLSPRMQWLTRIMMARSKGPYLFTNSQGNQWKTNTISQKLRRLRTKLGLPKDLVTHSARHGFATDALVNGVPLEAVSELLGHRDTRMVSKVYGHLDQAKDYLLNAADKARKKRS